MQGTEKELDRRLRPLLDAFSGECAAAFAAQDGSLAWSCRASMLLPAASTIKIFVLGAVLAACERGTLALEQELVLRDADKVGGSGLLCDLHGGLRLTVWDAALLMIAVSDNTATNLLIDAAGGVQAVQAHMRSAGIRRSRLNRKLSEDPAVMSQCVLAQACTGEFVRYLLDLHAGKILRPTSVQVFDTLLEKQRYKDFVPARLPLAEDWPECWPDAAEPVFAACKTGWMPGIRCDTGYLRFAGSEYAYAVMTSACRDLRPNAENEAVRLLREIGWQFYQAVRNQ